MEGAVASSSGGGRISVLAGCDAEWPEPISARGGAAQEVWLGLSRRLIPRPGQCLLPGAMGARRKLSPIVWAVAVRTVSRSGGFGCEEHVVAAAGDLARDGQS